MTLLLALMLQVGPAPTSEPIPALPPEMEQQRADRARRAAAAEDVVAPSRLAQCLARTRRDPGGAVEEAEAWLESARGAQRGDAGQCLGVAQAQLGQGAASAETFLAARDATPEGDLRLRALRGALAGGALLGEGDPAGALALLDAAREDAHAAGEGTIAGQIALDRAIALVALDRADEAAQALAAARAALPDNAQAWLLSATLSRRTGDLAEAQARIERAAELAPRDPAVGLEAGVIAAMAGRDEAARRSWLSVIEMAPDSPAAARAQAYIDRLEPA